MTTCLVVLEGVALKKAGLPVYEGNTFHGVSILMQEEC